MDLSLLPSVPLLPSYEQHYHILPVIPIIPQTPLKVVQPTHTLLFGPKLPAPSPCTSMQTNPSHHLLGLYSTHVPTTADSAPVIMPSHFARAWSSGVLKSGSRYARQEKLWQSRHRVSLSQCFFPRHQVCMPHGSDAVSNVLTSQILTIIIPILVFGSAFSAHSGIIRKLWSNQPL